MYVIFMIFARLRWSSLNRSKRSYTLSINRCQRSLTKTSGQCSERIQAPLALHLMFAGKKFYYCFFKIVDVFRYVDLYMTKAVNLLNYSMSHRFYPSNAMHMVRWSSLNKVFSLTDLRHMISKYPLNNKISTGNSNHYRIHRIFKTKLHLYLRYISCNSWCYLLHAMWWSGDGVPCSTPIRTRIRF